MFEAITVLASAKVIRTSLTTVLKTLDKVGPTCNDEQKEVLRKAVDVTQVALDENTMMGDSTQGEFFNAPDVLGMCKVIKTSIGTAIKAVDKVGPTCNDVQKEDLRKAVKCLDVALVEALKVGDSAYPLVHKFAQNVGDAVLQKLKEKDLALAKG